MSRRPDRGRRRNLEKFIHFSVVGGINLIQHRRVGEKGASGGGRVKGIPPHASPVSKNRTVEILTVGKRVKN